MDTVTLQIPMTKSLRDNAVKAAKKQGFSSLQEAARVIFTKMVDGKFTFTVSEPTVYLSPKAEARYRKIEADFKSGKNITTANSLEEFFSQLET